MLKGAERDGGGGGGGGLMVRSSPAECRGVEESKARTDEQEQLSK